MGRACKKRHLIFLPERPSTRLVDPVSIDIYQPREIPLRFCVQQDASRLAQTQRFEGDRADFAITHNGTRRKAKYPKSD